MYVYLLDDKYLQQINIFALKLGLQLIFLLLGTNLLDIIITKFSYSPYELWYVIKETTINGQTQKQMTSSVNAYQ